MNYYYVLSRLLCFTKNGIFKKLINITLFFTLVLLFFGSFNDPFDDYHNQQFELFYEDENVIIWHSRSLDIPKHPIKKELDFQYMYYDYKIWEKIDKKLNRKTLDSY